MNLLNFIRLVIQTLIFSIVLAMGALPSFAKLDGNVSKNTFYDMEKTIMPEVVPNKTVTTAKYWEKNILHLNRYKPLFMLSNIELYDLMPKSKASVIQRISTPSVYNISLKTASIKKVSFNTPKPAVQTQTEDTNAIVTSKSEAASIYEAAKNPDVDLEKKIDAALSLKKMSNSSSYVLAIDLLDDVTRKEPYNAYAYYLKGELYSAQNDPERAMQNYIEALKINPTSKQCCLGIAKILEPTNKELAQKYYDKAK